MTRNDLGGAVPWMSPLLLAVLPVLIVIGVAATVTVRMAGSSPPPPHLAGAFTPWDAVGGAITLGPGSPPAGWAVLRTDGSGRPLVATAVVHPYPGGSTVVGAAWMSRDALRFTLVPGTEQPGGRWATNGQVPDALRPDLVAVFNSGFKYKDITGGFAAEGRVARPLVGGQASLVVHDDGTADIAVWGRDANLAPDVTAVRQNMRLIVDAGQAATGLRSAHDGGWGKAHWKTQSTGRSGLGQRADGSLVYVAGPGLDLQQLADALVAVGAERGMELDIHRNMETFHVFEPRAEGGLGRSHELLVDLMTAGPGRYLVPDRRDFVTVTVR